ncbi:MAG: alpha/beta hydrolase [Acidobacteria bacterium]|nr:alpha/beta hydrolase [Acidobacteriota bacterium]
MRQKKLDGEKQTSASRACNICRDARSAAAWKIPVLLGIAFIAVFSSSLPGTPPPAKTTYTYKRVGNLEIRADVYRPGDPGERPVLVNVHGGALMKSGRESLPRPVPDLIEKGYVVVSVDYRLGPETRLPEIIEDVADACRWVRSRGRSLFGADTRKMGVIGHSAGGFLTLAMGHRLQPPPSFLVSFYGYGELVGHWATGPSPDPEHWETSISAEEADKRPADPPISNASERSYSILPYYNYYRQKGLWPKMLTGWDPIAEKYKYVPYLPLFNVTPAYPPTLLVHGSRDMDVPAQQSRLMADRLTQHNVEHELLILEGAEHGLRGVDPQRLEEAYRTAIRFVDRFMGR